MTPETDGVLSRRPFVVEGYTPRGSLELIESESTNQHAEMNRPKISTYLNPGTPEKKSPAAKRPRGKGPGFCPLRTYGDFFFFFAYGEKCVSLRRKRMRPSKKSISAACRTLPSAGGAQTGRCSDGKIAPAHRHTSPNHNYNPSQQCINYPWGIYYLSLIGLTRYSY